MQSQKQLLKGFDPNNEDHVVIEGKRHAVSGKKLTKDVWVDITQVKYLQVCTSGAKYGNSHRKRRRRNVTSDRPLGQIFPREDLNIRSEDALAFWIESGTLKPRTKNDFEIQKTHGIDAIPWQYPVSPGKDILIEAPAGFVAIRETPVKVDDAHLVPKAVTPAQKARASLEAQLAEVERLEKEESGDEDEEEEIEEEEVEEEPLVIDPRIGFESKEAYWAEFKISGERGSVCGNCGEKHANVASHWACFETCGVPGSEEE